MLECDMTKLDRALHRLASLPPGRQEEIAEVLDQIMDLDADSASMPAWQIEELKRRLASGDDIASDEEVEAFFNESK